MIRTLLNAYASERVLDISHQKLVSYDKETRIIPQEENSRPHMKEFNNYSNLIFF